MNYSLFGSVDVEKPLLDLFEEWVASRARKKTGPRTQRALREESADVYREMWQAFVGYCGPRGLGLDNLTMEDLEIYLQVRGTGTEDQPAHVTTKGDYLSTRYAHRILSLIDWLTRFDAKRSGKPVNTAAQELLDKPEYKFAHAQDKDPLPEYLNGSEAKRLIAYVTQFRASRPGDAPMSWKDMRDRTAIALMLGAGLSPGEVRALKIDGVVSAGGRKLGLPWKLQVEGDGTHPRRETPVSEWAGRQLAFWLEMRANLGIPGSLVFPSTAKGTEWSHTRCFVACKTVLEKAGLGDHSNGLYKLRHTFALRQLSKGKSEEEVCKWLGLSSVSKMSRYSRIVISQVDLV